MNQFFIEIWLVEKLIQNPPPLIFYNIDLFAFLTRTIIATNGHWTRSTTQLIFRRGRETRSKPPKA